METINSLGGAWLQSAVLAWSHTLVMALLFQRNSILQPIYIKIYGRSISGQAEERAYRKRDWIIE